VKSRWPIVALALLAAVAFALSVWAGRWWSIGDVEIGPFGSKQCFGGGDCRPTSLTWIGGSERWMRMGMATWAGGLIAMLVLLITAAGVAAKRIPRLAARTALVAIATVTITGVLFIMQFPGVDGAQVDRGLWLWLAGILLGSIAAVGVVRARIPAAVD
jgi:hypothetical protein